MNLGKLLLVKKQIQLQKKGKIKTLIKKVFLDRLKYFKEDTEALVFEEEKGDFGEDHIMLFIV
jgi:hypothetical protein